jgi:hypothetical protein
MLKFLIENFIIIILGLFVLTQVIYPSFFPKVQYFWIFRGVKKEEDLTEGEPITLPAGFRYVKKDEVIPAGDYTTMVNISNGRTITNAPYATPKRKDTPDEPHLGIGA